MRSVPRPRGDEIRGGDIGRRAARALAARAPANRSLLYLPLLVAATALLLALHAGCNGDVTTTTTAETERPATMTAPTTPTTTDGLLDDILGGDVLPDVVGLDLQLAQDTLQAGGWYLISSTDETGRDRMQVIDRNWVVVEQEPPAGTQTSFTKVIELRVVKEGEAGSDVLEEPQGLPAVVGLNLQLAIDTMQAAGYYRIQFVDVTGRGRRPIVHSNWVVVEQSPAPGAEPPTTSAITLSVKKEGE